MGRVRHLFIKSLKNEQFCFDLLSFVVTTQWTFSINKSVKQLKKIALKLVINCIVLKSNIMLYLPTTDLVVNKIIVRRNHYADNGKNNDNFHLKCKQFYFLFYRNELIQVITCFRLYRSLEPLHLILINDFCFIVLSKVINIDRKYLITQVLSI